MKTNLSSQPSESSLAAAEFARWIHSRGPAFRRAEPYEVHPCKRVRGFMLRLPGIGWKLWFPTSSHAVNFARRVASIYSADCFVYDSDGRQTRVPAAPV